MKIRILILLLFITTNLHAQEDQLTPQEKAQQQMQLMFSGGMQDSILNHMPDSLAQQMQERYGIDIKEAMKESFPKALENMKNGMAGINVQDSLQKYMPSTEEERAAVLENLKDNGFGRMLVDSMAKGSLMSPTSGSHYDDFQLAKEGKIVYSNEGLYNYALDQKELRLAGMKKYREELKEIEKESMNYNFSEPQFNSFETIPPDYDYDKNDYEGPTFEERLAKAETEEERELLIKEFQDLGVKSTQLQINPFGSSLMARAINWEEIHSSLPAKSAAIEFIRMKETADDEQGSIYAAAILLSDLEQPQKVILGRAEKLDSLLKANKKASPDKRYKRGGIPLGGNNSPERALYDFIWSRVDSLLGDVENVYYVPDGLLHEIAFAALQDKDKKYLADKYNLYQLGTTRTLIEGVAKVYPPKDKCWILAGGLSYDEIPNLPSKSKSTTCAITMDSIPFPSHAIKLEKKTIVELPGSKKEIDALSIMLRKQGVDFQKFSGAEAPEEFFKRMGAYFDNPGVLHIGTHGFYFRKSKQKKSNDNLEESGLYLSGAGLKGFKSYSPPHTEDGHWTAKEIIGQNFFGTKLVVLSACNSGRGNAQVKDGIFGLQGAFKLAGVDKMIVSLWEISDSGTAVFMETFYKHWLSGKTAHQAFRATQRDMQKHPTYNTPYYWAAFVLLE